jgi:hypothetical protein
MQSRKRVLLLAKPVALWLQNLVELKESNAFFFFVSFFLMFFRYVEHFSHAAAFGDLRKL